MSQGTVVPGDPFGERKTPKDKTTPRPEEVNRFHDRSDKDSGADAQHHTLGFQHNQAAPGDHTHDGKNSKKLMAGITVTGSRGGNAALASLITKLSAALGFTDATTP